MFDFTMNESSLKIIKNSENLYNLPYLWIRDNCSCDQCRVKETQEKRFMLNAVSVDLKPKKVVIDKDIVSIEWPDNHETSINISELENLNKSIFNGQTLSKKNYQINPKPNFKNYY